VPATVIVNNLTVVHKKSGGTSVAGPDVCKTPSPGGPVPVPYANTALSKKTAKGSRQVRIDGQPVMLKSSQFSASNGDEPGTLGGLISGKSRGKAYPRSYSSDVKIEGQPVFRFTDLMAQNAGSPANAAGIESQGNVVVARPARPAAELIWMKWSASDKVCCGDAVKLAIRTRNTQRGDVLRTLSSRTDTKDLAIVDGLTVDLTSDRIEAWWLTRWNHPYSEKFDIIAEQVSMKGPERSENALHCQSVPTTKMINVGPKDVRLPRFDFDKDKNQWVHVKNTRWRLRYQYEIGVSHGSLRVIRALAFELSPGTNPVDTATFRRWKAEIETIWNNKFYFHRIDCRRGDRCDCPQAGCCKYPLSITVGAGGRHGTVKLNTGGPKRENARKQGLWWSSHTWWTEFGDARTVVRAHEFGHLIGLYDEYPGGAGDPAGPWGGQPTAETRASNSIMGRGTAVYERHVQRFLEWFESNVGSVVGRVKIMRSY
jgi:hypothetical protein